MPLPDTAIRKASASTVKLSDGGGLQLHLYPKVVDAEGKQLGVREVLSYNGIVQSWPEIARLVCTSAATAAAPTATAQISMDV